jgi:CBS domain containing-hemolysin-like protein
MTDFWLRFFSVVFLIGINAFFVTAEFSIVSVRRSRINQLVEAGDLQAQTVQSLQRSIDRLLSTTQLGITLSSLALGWIGENTMAVLVNDFMGKLPLPVELLHWLSHSLAIPIAFFLIAYLQMVLGELCPKSVALLYSEQLARFFAAPVGAIAKIFNPFIWILNQSTRWLLRLVKIEYSGQGWYSRVTPEELQLIITTERESSGLEKEERELLKNVFEFGDVLAEEVMIPRTKIEALNETDTFSKLLQQVADTEHSRYPVIRESLDDIIGIIDFKDLALPLAKQKITTDTSIVNWIKPVTFIPETTTLSELLPLMQSSNLKMVIVVDEFGGTAGLVTLQNLIAEIIGDEIELDGDELAIEKIDESSYLVEAQLSIEEVNEELSINLPITEDYQTLAGFIIYQWQKIPSEGEIFNYDNLILTITSANGPRLEKIMIQIVGREKEVSELNIAAHSLNRGLNYDQ